MNISEKTEITGWEGKRSTLAHAAWQQDMVRNVHYSYFGRRVRRGTMELLLKNEWRTVRFDVENGWARKVEVL